MDLFLPSSCPEQNRSRDWIYSVTTGDQLTADRTQNDHPSESRSHHGIFKCPVATSMETFTQKLETLMEAVVALPCGKNISKYELCVPNRGLDAHLERLGMPSPQGTIVVTAEFPTVENLDAYQSSTYFHSLQRKWQGNSAHVDSLNPKSVVLRNGMRVGGSARISNTRWDFKSASSSTLTATGTLGTRWALFGPLDILSTSFQNQQYRLDGGGTASAIDYDFRPGYRRITPSTWGRAMDLNAVLFSHGRGQHVLPAILFPQILFDTLGEDKRLRMPLNGAWGKASCA
ncbi:hypothetical protein B0H17DRAFT_1154626 [Mycena rosella]|uniref:Uncharacterized protein n=1 Tax=Mycena rosella TaxID=1033263 RepID=A0AAD7F8T5_MYCRO|nr:hypothetical protein B0H17DRAFT_1154626 [Mycena rosella]